MKVEFSQEVAFQGVHSLKRDVDPHAAAASRRVHGHDYQATACIAREPGPDGMVVDQATLRAAISAVTDDWQGVVLDDIDDLGPATVENMAIALWRALAKTQPDLLWVSVGRRAHGDLAVCRG